MPTSRLLDLVMSQGNKIALAGVIVIAIGLLGGPCKYLLTRREKRADRQHGELIERLAETILEFSRIQHEAHGWQNLLFSTWQLAGVLGEHSALIDEVMLCLQEKGRAERTRAPGGTEAWLIKPVSTSNLAPQFWSP